MQFIINHTPIKLYKRPSFHTEKNTIKEDEKQTFIWIHWNLQKTQFLWTDKLKSFIRASDSKWLKSFLPIQMGEKNERHIGLNVRVTFSPYQKGHVSRQFLEPHSQLLPLEEASAVTCCFTDWHILLHDLKAPGILSSWNWDLQVTNSSGISSIYQIPNELPTEAFQFSLCTDLLNMLISGSHKKKKHHANW